jgi:hypothetical protein
LYNKNKEGERRGEEMRGGIEGRGEEVRREKRRSKEERR